MWNRSPSTPAATHISGFGAAPSFGTFRSVPSPAAPAPVDNYEEDATDNMQPTASNLASKLSFFGSSLKGKEDSGFIEEPIAETTEHRRHENEHTRQMGEHDGLVSSPREEKHDFTFAESGREQPEVGENSSFKPAPISFSSQQLPAPDRPMFGTSSQAVPTFAAPSPAPSAPAAVSPSPTPAPRSSATSFGALPSSPAATGFLSSFGAPTIRFVMLAAIVMMVSSPGAAISTNRHQPEHPAEGVKIHEPVGRQVAGLKEDQQNYINCIFDRMKEVKTMDRFCTSVLMRKLGSSMMETYCHEEERLLTLCTHEYLIDRCENYFVLSFHDQIKQDENFGNQVRAIVYKSKSTECKQVENVQQYTMDDHRRFVLGSLLAALVISFFIARCHFGLKMPWEVATINPNRQRGGQRANRRHY